MSSQYSSLQRDPSTKAIINTDDSHYKAILAARQSKKESEEMCEKLNAIELELTEIKMLLEQFLAGKKNG